MAPASEDAIVSFIRWRYRGRYLSNTDAVQYLLSYEVKQVEFPSRRIEEALAPVFNDHSKSRKEVRVIQHRWTVPSKFNLIAVWGNLLLTPPSTQRNLNSIQLNSTQLNLNLTSTQLIAVVDGILLDYFILSLSRRARFHMILYIKVNNAAATVYGCNANHDTQRNVEK